MTGHLKPLCSILGTLLCLAIIASPGAAQKKKKKAAEDAPAAEASAEAEAGGSLDSLMEDAAEKKDDKKKKGKKGEEPAAEETAEEAPAEEPVAEPDEWERPPMEEKAPPKESAPVDVLPTIEKPISAALLLGWGFMTDRRGGGADPYGFMAGLRGGYTFDFKLYAGLYFNYYFGETRTGDSAQIGGQSEQSASYMHFGAEVGYDAEIGPVQFRPSLQLGVALGLASLDGSPTDSEGSLMLGPGMTVVHPIDDFFIGGDLRGQIVTGNGVSAVTVAATGGMRF